MNVRYPGRVRDVPNMTFRYVLESFKVNGYPFTFASLLDRKLLLKYSQTCLKGSPKGRTKIGFLRQVSPNTGSFTLYFGPKDPENMAA